MPNSLIISREKIQLNKAMQSAVRKMYDDSVIEDTIVEHLTYRSGDLKINGYIARPKKDGAYPVLIWNRGGRGDSGAITELTAHLILASTAVWGYTVIATQYRGNMGSEGEEDWAGKDLDDALKLIDVTEEIEAADTSRMAVEGASRGGMTTYRMLAREHPFKCAMVHAGISDLFRLGDEKEDFDRLLDKLFGELDDKDKEKALKSRSGVYLAKEFSDEVPLLLLHGTEDKTVPFSQSEAMVKALKDAGIPHEFVSLEGAGHVALKDGSYKEVDKHRRKWLAKHLGTADN